MSALKDHPIAANPKEAVAESKFRAGGGATGAAGQQHGLGVGVGKTAVSAEELARMPLRLDVVTSIIGGWVWETDAEHRFVYMSPSVERYAGKSPEWHYGKTRQELGNMNVRTADGGSWLAQLEARSSFGPVDFIRYQNGHALMMRTIGHPQFDAEGNFTGYIGIAFEITGDSAPEPAERRSEPRERVARVAELAIDGAPGMACILVDISKSGARLRLPEAMKLPSRFRLSVPSMSLDRECDLRWQRECDAGVKFCD